MKQNSKEKKIVLTGGHAATTAISIIEELVRRNSSNNKIVWDIYWIGAKTAYEGRRHRTLESQVFQRMMVKNFNIIAGRIQKKFTIWTIPSLLKIPLGFIHSFYFLSKIKPNVVLSFGGYAAFPVVFSAYILRIPIIIHEQTMGAGIANRLSSVFAEKVALSRKSSFRFFNKDKCVVVGNPIMTQISDIEVKTKKNEPPVILVTGGSRGSIALNELIFSELSNLLKGYNIIHQVGPISYRKAINLRNNLSFSQKKKYEVFERIDPLKIDNVYKQADIIIARSGANTVSEIISIKRPAILVPLPVSDKFDQLANAKYAEDFGIAKVMLQKNITTDKLLKVIGNINRNWKDIVENVKNKKSIDLGASRKLVDLLEKTVK